LRDINVIVIDAAIVIVYGCIAILLNPLLFLMLIPVMMIHHFFSNQMLVLSSTCLANCPRCATNITCDINAPGEGGIGIITHGTCWNTSGAENILQGAFGATVRALIIRI
jgi:hypothetical protein